MQTNDPIYASLKRVHARLDEAYVIERQTPQHHNPLFADILAASPGTYEGDFASASGTCTTLVSMGALSARRNPEDGSTTYTKQPFPEPRDSLDWVAAENAQNARIAEQERAMMARERENMEAAQRVLNEPARQAKLADFAYLTREHGGLAKLEERVHELEEQVADLQRHLAAT